MPKVVSNRTNAIAQQVLPMKRDAARRLALSLPEATEAPHFHYASFRVQGKIFATAPPDGEYLHVFVADDERDAASAVAPACVENLLWGARVVGVRVLLARASPALVKRLLSQAWARKAPKRLQKGLP
jgi:hypothetical protein